MIIVTILIYLERFVVVVTNARFKGGAEAYGFHGPHPHPETEAFKLKMSYFHTYAK